MHCAIVFLKRAYTRPPFQLFRRRSVGTPEKKPGPADGDGGKQLLHARIPGCISNTVYWL